LRLGVLLVAVALLNGPARAHHDAPSVLGPNEGEVLEVDRAAKEITIRHGPLPELGMDPMSMVFVVAAPELLDRVQKGDHVTFKAGLVGGRFGVLSIQPVRARSPK
jgi:Cu(I)/Ag(I) efflux system periplasmic protein CusF